MSESEIQQQIQMEGVRYGTQLMRNNSGAFKDATGRWVRYGLGNVSKKHGTNIKSSDLIGFTRVTITQEMVGQVVAIFTAVEVKRPTSVLKQIDKRLQAQMAFISWIRAAGGFAGIAQSIEDFRRIIGV